MLCPICGTEFRKAHMCKVGLVVDLSEVDPEDLRKQLSELDIPVDISRPGLLVFSDDMKECPLCNTPLSGNSCPECGVVVTKADRVQVFESLDDVDATAISSAFQVFFEERKAAFHALIDRDEEFPISIAREFHASCLRAALTAACMGAQYCRLATLEKQMSKRDARTFRNSMFDYAWAAATVRGAANHMANRIKDDMEIRPGPWLSVVNPSYPLAAPWAVAKDELDVETWAESVATVDLIDSIIYLSSEARSYRERAVRALQKSDWLWERLRSAKNKVMGAFSETLIITYILPDMTKDYLETVPDRLHRMSGADPKVLGMLIGKRTEVLKLIAKQKENLEAARAQGMDDLIVGVTTSPELAEHFGKDLDRLYDLVAEAKSIYGQVLLSQFDKPMTL